MGLSLGGRVRWSLLSRPECLNNPVWDMAKPRRELIAILRSFGWLFAVGVTACLIWYFFGQLTWRTTAALDQAINAPLLTVYVPHGEATDPRDIELLYGEEDVPLPREPSKYWISLITPARITGRLLLDVADVLSCYEGRVSNELSPVQQARRVAVVKGESGYEARETGAAARSNERTVLRCFLPFGLSRPASLTRRFAQFRYDEPLGPVSHAEEGNYSPLSAVTLKLTLKDVERISFIGGWPPTFEVRQPEIARLLHLNSGVTAIWDDRIGEQRRDVYLLVLGALFGFLPTALVEAFRPWSNRVLKTFYAGVLIGWGGVKHALGEARDALCRHDVH